MPVSQKRMQELLQKANTLPLCPGVYIMRDKQNRVIYVGKAKKLTVDSILPWSCIVRM